MGLFLCHAAFAQSESSSYPTQQEQKNFDYEFFEVDAVSLIRVLAGDLRRNVYIGPGVEGSISLKLDSVSPLEALEATLKQLPNQVGYKLVNSHTLVVATPDKLHQIEGDILGLRVVPRLPSNCVRQEFLLEKAPFSQMIALLRADYEEVEFIPHPTMNGFYAVGRRSDLLSLKKRVLQLDQEW